jgi:hypothetical protein
MRPASRKFSIRLRSTERAGDEVPISKRREHRLPPLKFAEGGAASVGLMEG